MAERYAPFDWYEDALLYDIIFEADTGLETDFLETMNARHGRGGSRILEPACGTGRLVAALAARGHAVTGFDASDAMLAFARRRLRQRGLTARLTRGRLEAFAYRRPFDLAHCLVSTFKYVLEEAAARAHLQCIADALAPGGVYVLGLHLADYDDPGRTRERWTGERRGQEVVCNIQSWPADRRARRQRVRARMIVRENGEERRLESSWVFRTYSARQLETLIRAVPALEHVATHDFTMDPARTIPLDGERLDVVLVLRKR